MRGQLRQIRQRARRAADQHGQRVARAQDLAFELGDGAQGAEVLGTRLLQIQLVGLAAAEQPLGDLEAAMLQRRVVARDAQARFGGAQRVVGLGHLRVQQDQHIVTIGLRREVGGIGGLDGPREAPPEVEFPADIEVGAVLPEAAVGGIAAPGLAPVRVEHVGAHLLHLRKAAALGDAELGARFQHAQAGDLEPGVVGIGLGHQPLERRVGKDLPPLAEVRLCARLRHRVDGLAAPACGPVLALRRHIGAQPGAAVQAAEGKPQQMPGAERDGHGRACPRQARGISTGATAVAPGAPGRGSPDTTSMATGSLARGGSSTHSQNSR
ncbi:hypothetical protein D3C72_899290 [compost metagenome]